MQSIVELKLNNLGKTLMENRGITLTYSENVLNEISDKCKIGEIGARNIDFVLNDGIKHNLAQNILNSVKGEETPLGVQIDVDENGGFTVDFHNDHN